jgi:hypothetical protein
MPMQLFTGTLTVHARMARLKLMLDEIARYGPNYIIDADLDKVVDYLWNKYRFEVPVVHLDKKVIVDQGESGNGVYVTLSIPFEGSREPLAMQPMSSVSGCPTAEIGTGSLSITYDGTNAGWIKATMEREFQALEHNLKSVANDLSTFDDELKNRARQELQKRKDKLKGDKSLVESLGIPILRREQSPPTYPAPEVRRKPPVAPPPIPDKPSDPTLELAEYENILEIISNMVKVMERSPKAFAHMDEESLRDHILVHLNGHYEGQATGETFNFEGKTDILIRARGGNIFIAECKFWHGKKAYLEALDQLMGYVTWRDTKTAIILFNRQKDLSAVLAQIPDATKEHPAYKAGPDYRSETSFRFVLKNATDAKRELLMTVLVFDVPS